MTLLEEAWDQFEFSRDLRRDLHRHPELGFEEYRTAGIVSAELNRLGFEVTTGVGKTGVVGMLEGGGPGPTVLVRFDMDALPVTEETGADYASQTPGKMHACGHDGHVAVGLTVARLLSARRGDLAGNVKFLFQPAEEGRGGAESVLEAGVLSNPRPDLTLALHIWNEKPLGWVGVVPGPLMAGGEIFHVRIAGKGGHGAMPDQTIDPMVATAQIISALQTIVSRNVSPLEAAVVSVTRVWGGETFNVIPPYVEFQGTIRTFIAPVRERVLVRFKQIVEGVASAMGCEAEVSTRLLTPSVINDPEVAQRLQKVFVKVDPTIDMDSTYRTTVSEDMAYIMREVPGCYFMVGSANPGKGLDYTHHHPRFDFDEAVLPRASALMAGAVLELLQPASSASTVENNISTVRESDDKPVQIPACYLMPGSGKDAAAVLQKIPGRVVSLVPSLTESLFDLGLGSGVVGVTDFCILPEKVAGPLARVGGTKDARLVDILALNPDLVISSEEENSKELVEALQRDGISVLVANVRTVAHSIEFLWRLVDIFHSQPAGQRIRSLEMALDWATTAQVDLQSWRYFCPIWMDNTSTGQAWWMTFNQSTYSSDLLELFGGENVFSLRNRRHPLEADLGLIPAEMAGSRDTRYPRVSLSEIIAAQPELILLPSEPFAFKAPHLDLFRQWFADTPAVRQDRIIFVDGKLLTWYGTHLGKAISELPSLLSQD